MKKIHTVPKNTNPLTCAQQVINFSSIKQTDRFDKQSFDSEKFLDKLKYSSPKLVSLIENIHKLDKADYHKEQKLYKHYIYSGVGNGYGSKIIISALVAAGYTLINKPKGSRIVIDTDILLSDDSAKVAVLSSTALWNNPTTPKITKEVLDVYNKRPENIHGDLVRFIVLDSGFKEGIDLYDVKYTHIFEDQLYNSDNVQSWGRALRYCGQSGLPFKNGWTVNVYNYSLYRIIPRFWFLKGKESILDYLKKTNRMISYNNNFGSSLDDIIQKNSIDYTLNKNTVYVSKSNIVRNIIIASTAIIGTAAVTAAVHNYNVKIEKTKAINSFIKRFGKTKK